MYTVTILLHFVCKIYLYSPSPREYVRRTGGRVFWGLRTVELIGHKYSNPPSGFAALPPRGELLVMSREQNSPSPREYVHRTGGRVFCYEILFIVINHTIYFFFNATPYGVILLVFSIFSREFMSTTTISNKKQIICICRF